MAYDDTLKGDDPGSALVALEKASQYAAIRAKSSDRMAAANELGLSWHEALAIEKSPAFKDAVGEILFVAGVNPSVIGKKLGEMLEATTQKEFVTRSGAVVMGEIRVDHRTRTRALEIVMSLAGIKVGPRPGGGAALKIETHTTVNDNRSLNVLHVKAEVIRQLPDDQILAMLQGEEIILEPQAAVRDQS